ncbi:hypothetical protein AcV7_007217 [Taiwanofungus camphoratus]|nr:hypothetical protein AcV7_007217 [Antrodia cinnamomea]
MSDSSSTKLKCQLQLVLLLKMLFCGHLQLNHCSILFSVSCAVFLACRITTNNLNFASTSPNCDCPSWRCHGDALEDKYAMDW